MGSHFHFKFKLLSQFDIEMDKIFVTKDRINYKGKQDFLIFKVKLSDTFIGERELVNLRLVFIKMKDFK